MEFTGQLQCLPASVSGRYPVTHEFSKITVFYTSILISSSHLRWDVRSYL